ncbi:SIMPL domain-containing protein [Paenibacillus sp. Marseille-Q4541]|uniref:SIMPL domain-containing protein n=1 Tax=Paenibacillus sp. Marseille-Q4541 TaxID=2831522 RepID=UPI001BAB7104|nr:SIMPL domain-containing protein [Paenibacillus sp. Marseille-Q4541]
MKKTVWIKPAAAVVIAGTMLIGGGGGALSFAGKAQAQEAVAVQNIVSVVGKGEISVKPDIAYLFIGISSEGKTAAAAQKANATKMQSLTSLLKKTWKLENKDIQTNQFYVQPNYTYSEKEGQQLKGYTATHSLKVSYRDLDKVGELLDAAAEAGVNQIDNIQFSIENKDAFETAVIEKAMANANLKAGAIAKVAGRSLGSVISVSQGNTAEPVRYYEQMYDMNTAASSTAEKSTSVEAGEIKLTTELTVHYQLK